MPAARHWRRWLLGAVFAILTIFSPLAGSGSYADSLWWGGGNIEFSDEEIYTMWENARAIEIPGVPMDARFDADWERVLHVDRNHASANDNNPGTESKPWRTLAHAVSQLQPGDLLLVHDATYDAPLDMKVWASTEQPVAVRAAPGSRPILQFPQSYLDEANAALTAEPNSNQYAFSMVRINGSNVEFSGFHLIGPRDYMPYNTLYRGNGIFVHHAGDGNRVIGNIIEQVQATGIKVAKGQSIIDGNLIHHNGTRYPHDHGIYFKADNTLVRRNVILNNRTNGVNINDHITDYARVTHNLIVGHNLWGAVCNGTNNLFAHNVFYNNADSAFVFYGDSESNRAVNNVFIQEQGILFNEPLSFDRNNVASHNAALDTSQERLTGTSQWPTAADRATFVEIVPSREFVDYGNWDFTMVSSSTLDDAGIDVGYGPAIGWGMQSAGASPVRNLVGAPSGDDVALIWTTPDSYPVQIEYRDTIQSTWQSPISVDGSLTKHKVPDLTVGRTYEFRVATNNGVALSAYRYVTVTVDGSQIDPYAHAYQEALVQRGVAREEINAVWLDQLVRRLQTTDEVAGVPGVDIWDDLSVLGVFKEVGGKKTNLGAGDKALLLRGWDGIGVATASVSMDLIDLNREIHDGHTWDADGFQGHADGEYAVMDLLNHPIDYTNGGGVTLLTQLRHDETSQQHGAIIGLVGSGKDNQDANSTSLMEGTGKAFSLLLGGSGGVPGGHNVGHGEVGTFGFRSTAQAVDILSGGSIRKTMDGLSRVSQLPTKLTLGTRWRPPEADGYLGRLTKHSYSMLLMVNRPLSDLEIARLEAILGAAEVGTIKTSQSSLSQTGEKGLPVPSQDFAIQIPGGNATGYTVTDNRSWISVSPASGVNSGEWDQITVSYSIGHLEPRDYNGIITISANDGSIAPTQVLVSLTVEDYTSSWWNEGGFGSDSNDLTVTGADADPDGDGLSNLFEYATGSDPMAMDSPPFAVGGFDDGTDFVLTMTYQRDLRATDLTYTVEWSHDLRYWSAENVTLVNRGTDGDIQTVEAQVRCPDAGVAALRLRVSGSGYETQSGGTISTMTSPVLAGQSVSLPTQIAPLNFPVARERLLTARVAAVEDTVLDLSGSGLDVPALVGTSVPAYVEVLDGVGAGHRLEVNLLATAFEEPEKVAVSLNDENTTTTNLDQLVGSTIVIRPHWTLGAVFGDTDTVLQAGTSIATSDQVFIFRDGLIDIYYPLLSGSTTSWRKLGLGEVDMAAVPLLPGEAIFLNRVDTGPVDLFLSGEARANEFRENVTPGVGIYGSAFPTDMSPAELGLTAANGVNFGPTLGNADAIYLPTENGLEIFYLYSNNGGATTQWRKLGGGTTDYSDEPFLESSSAYFVMRHGGELALMAPAPY